MKTIENVPFDEIFVGQTCEHRKTVTEKDILLFAIVSGDSNPVHVDENYAKTTQFGERIAHGMYTSALVSAAMATDLPGPGSVYLTQSMKFKQPVKVGDTLDIRIEVIKKRAGKNFVTFSTVVTNQHGDRVLLGEAMARVASEKIVLPASELPLLSLG